MKLKYDLYPSLRIYDELGVDYILLDKAEGPQWTGKTMLLEASFDDMGIFHELAHWWVASEHQRKFPDFALGRQVSGLSHRFTASNVDYLYLAGTEPRKPGHNNGWGENTIPTEVAGKQESFACFAMLLHLPIVHRSWEVSPEDLDWETIEAFNALIDGWPNDDEIKQLAKMSRDMGLPGTVREVRSWLTRAETWYERDIEVTYEV